MNPIKGLCQLFSEVINEAKENVAIIENLNYVTGHKWKTQNVNISGVYQTFFCSDFKGDKEESKEELKRINDLFPDANISFHRMFYFTNTISIYKRSALQLGLGPLDKKSEGNFTKQEMK